MFISQFIKKYQTQCAIALAMLFACVVSISFFMGKSLRLDEAQSLFQTNGTFLGTIRIIAGDIHLPVYFISLQVWQSLFGDSLLAIRSLSLVFLLCSLPFIYLLGKETYGKKVGMITVMLCALSPFLQWFGAETRMYTVLFLITILNQLFFVRLWNNSEKRSWFLYALTVIIGVYTHFFFALLLIAQALFFLMNRDLFPEGSFKKFIFTASGALTTLGLWFVVRHIVGSTNSAPNLTAPTSIDIFNLFSNFMIGFQSDTVNTFFLALWPIVVLFGFTFLTKKHTVLPQTKYFLITFFVPATLAFVVSITFKPLFLSRYLIIILPSLYLLVVHFLNFYPAKVFRYLITAIVILLLYMLSLEAFSPEVPTHENFRGAAEYVAEHAKANDAFIVSAPFITYPVEYYYKGDTQLMTFPIWKRFEDIKKVPDFSEQYMIDTFTAWSKDYARFYVLLGYDQGYEKNIQEYLDNTYERIEVKNFSPHLNLYVYKVKNI
ncbi:MAG: glycosyltransferase family 39 protein [Patescibacteria group bacterium]